MLYHFPRKFLLLLALTAAGCATGHQRADHEELNALRGQVAEMRSLFTALTSRLETVEVKVNSLTATSGMPSGTEVSTDRLSSNHASPVIPHPGEGSGISPAEVPSPKDPDGAFINDDAVQEFRNAMIRFRAGQYAESASGFSLFLEKYPDHALAGNAGYLVGRSFFLLKDYKRAADEYNRVLTTYDRSSHVAAALRDLADIEDLKSETDESARHRQLLTSLFPHSPESERPLGEAPLTAAPAAPTAPANTFSPALDDAPPTAPGPGVQMPGVSPISVAPEKIRSQDIPSPSPATKAVTGTAGFTLDGVPVKE